MRSSCHAQARQNRHLPEIQGRSPNGSREDSYSESRRNARPERGRLVSMEETDPVPGDRVSPVLVSLRKTDPSRSLIRAQFSQSGQRLGDVQRNARILLKSPH
jgi:hypothetical protein